MVAPDAGAFVRGLRGQPLGGADTQNGLERIGSDMIAARRKLVNSPPEMRSERGVVMQAWASELR